MSVKIDSAFNPTPSLDKESSVSVLASRNVYADACKNADSHTIFFVPEGETPYTVSGIEAAKTLTKSDFAGKLKQTVTGFYECPVTFVGTGTTPLTAASLRDAVAAGVRAAKKSENIFIDLTGQKTFAHVPAEQAARVSVEGAFLARYRFEALKSEPVEKPLRSLTIGVPEQEVAMAQKGVEAGRVFARTQALASDLGNTPPRHLTAVKFGEVVSSLAPRFGLTAEVYDHAGITELALGGLLGVNAGSVEEPRLVKLSYSPAEPVASLGFVGKGIMYDSGGISLKPSGGLHAYMKLDMMGAAAVFAAMSALRDLGCENTVTGWLMCTDNMPSGSATKLGDVLTIRGGKTVEVKNTDAEGRLVLADGLALAREQQPDAIVNIATLTGAILAALGTGTAGLFTNSDGLCEQLVTAGEAVDENLWRMPLDKRYRSQLDSQVADLSNMGGSYGGAILAALFLQEFVGEIPWAHLDIASTMLAETDESWRSAGSTGFGARLLAEFACNFKTPETKQN